MKDYVNPTKRSSDHTYPISNHVDYSHLSTSYQAYIQAFSVLTEPRSFKEAATDKNWIEAMKQEVRALEDNQTWEVVPLPPRKQTVGSKWVYKIKYKANGEVDRFKARLVAKGYTQQEGLDYHETFSPVAKMVAVRTVIAVAASKDWPLFQMDVNNAFLQGDLKEEVYMEMPQGFRQQGEYMVCRLLKSLYGLKRASRQWNIKLTTALVQAGYIQSPYDHSIFTKKKRS